MFLTVALTFKIFAAILLEYSYDRTGGDVFCKILWDFLTCSFMMQNVTHINVIHSLVYELKFQKIENLIAVHII